MITETKQEIPTPITDAAEFSYYEDCDPEGDGMVVSSDKVRELERENTALKADRDRLLKAVMEIHEQAGTSVLNWRASIQESCRQAIDAAMKKEPDIK